MGRLGVSFDSSLLEQVCADFDLRTPNRDALRQLLFTLDGDYDPSVMQVLNLATGVGKTYLMAAFMEYLRRQGVGNVVIVTPGKTVQRKTVQNFTAGSRRYISGADVAPEVVTPDDYSAWVSRLNGDAQLSFGREKPMLAFVFNIQQLIAPKSLDGVTKDGSSGAGARRPRRFDETAGVLFDYLKGLDDLVVIADESHLYGASAKAFNAALVELEPAATIGLTASPSRGDNVIFQYPLYQAIRDEFVKTPVLAFRKKGYGEDQASEEQQLRDALALRAIKQRHWDAFAEGVGAPHLNALLFVVCSDVAHATDVTSLLRSSEYFGSDQAVLQVDSSQDDEKTQVLLDRLDAPDSPVLAVVSVNKLKEGWDVKNVAVMVTLRAMASEVLTQQTMGRGLRLPFGKYTGVHHIDRLDIIAHQSFKELLAAENVLQQFGLAGAVQGDGKTPEEAVREAVEALTGGDSNTGASTTGTAGDTTQPSDTATPAGGSGNTGGSGTPQVPPAGGGNTVVPVGTAQPGLPGLGMREIGNDAGQDELSVERVERAKARADISYNFPATTIKVTQPPIRLIEIDPRDIKEAASKVVAAKDVLIRKEIVAALNKTGAAKLTTSDAVQAEVESIHISEEEVRKTLLHLILTDRMLPAEPRHKRDAETYLIRNFMRDTGIAQWTVKALDSAELELRTLLHDFIKQTTRQTREEPTIQPVHLPSRDHHDIPVGQTVLDHVETRAEYVNHRFYRPWNRSLFDADRFDSYSGEYKVARLLDISEHIMWWHRLDSEPDARIYYTPRDRYFPDFVALDDEGIFWIIEGKNAGGAEDDNVQAKRRAAETVVIRLLGEDAFADQHWGYLIAYENDVATSDSWDDLKMKARPITNA